MKTSIKAGLMAGLIGIAAGQVPAVLGAESAEQAAMMKEKVQNLRIDCAEGRRQVNVTVEELKRLTAKDVELRPQLERFKAELVKMEAKAEKARERADTMRQKGEAFFAEWESQVQSIQNEEIRKAAEKRLTMRKKSYDKILRAMQEAKAELVPFMSDLNDLKKLFDSELTASTISSAKGLIRQTGWHGDDVCDSLMDVEKELDRVSAELAKYQ
jgi:chromosome segregation ATPase